MSAKLVIEKLGLEPLHPEGGFFIQTFKSPITSGGRSLMTSIYYLIMRDNFSALHRLKSTEVYHFYSGASVELTILNDDGQVSVVHLGDNLTAGEVPQFTVEAGAWQALRISDSAAMDWALLGTTVCPGFEFEDFELGWSESLIGRFPQQQELIRRLTRG